MKNSSNFQNNRNINFYKFLLISTLLILVLAGCQNANQSNTQTSNSTDNKSQTTGPSNDIITGNKPLENNSSENKSTQNTSTDNKTADNKTAEKKIKAPPAKAQAAFDKAMELLTKKEKDFEIALHNWANGIEDSPLTDADIKPIITNLDEAIKADSNFAEAYLIRGEMQLLISAADNVEAAAKDFNKVIDLEPSNAEAYYYLATTFSWATEKEKVLENLNKAIEFYPDYASAYFTRGNYYQEVEKDQQKAKQDFDKAKSLDPDLFKH